MSSRPFSALVIARAWELWKLEMGVELLQSVRIDQQNKAVVIRQVYTDGRDERTVVDFPAPSVDGGVAS